MHHDETVTRDNTFYCKDSGYATGYRPVKVQTIAKALARTIPDALKAFHADCIVVHGNSGVSAGFAALAHIDFPIVLVRKRGENTHGGPVEGVRGTPMRRYILLDDFISSGNTVRSVEQILAGMADSQGLRPPECAAVITYNGREIFPGVRNYSDVEEPPCRVMLGNNGNRIQILGVYYTPDEVKAMEV